LDIHERVQGEEPIILRNINLDTFALYWEYIYTGNYLISETVLASQNSSQVSLWLEEMKAEVFDGLFAVIVPKYLKESRTLLPTLFIHSYI
jgi:hypothetical protein